MFSQANEGSSTLGAGGLSWVASRFGYVVLSTPSPFHLRQKLSNNGVRSLLFGPQGQGRRNNVLSMAELFTDRFRPFWPETIGATFPCQQWRSSRSYCSMPKKRVPQCLPALHTKVSMFV